MYLSLGSNLLYDSSFLLHDAAGTGGSYARLSGSPNGFVIGGKAGVKLTEKIYLETTVKQSVLGKRFPVFFQGGLNLFVRFDFLQPDKRIKIKEIPFDSDPETDPS
jgi:hypothetical protein